MLWSFAALLSLLVSQDAPPQHYTAPARAADHVAEVVLGEGLGPRSQGRARIMRHGSWLREDRVQEGRATTIHSDFATGTSFTYARDPQGRYRSVWVIRIASTDRFRRYERVRTGRRDRALAQACTVWNTRRIGEAEGEGPRALSCDTADGITLWTRTQSGRSDTVFSNSRTLSFQRRPVAEAEPPGDLLGLDFWLGQQFGPTVETDYRVEFAARREGGRGARRILQRHGGWRSADRIDVDGSRRLEMYTPAASLMFEQEPDGRPVMLQAYVFAPGAVALDAGTWLPMPERADETVLGETCRWMRPQMVISDSGYYECRAADGVPLVIDEFSWGRSYFYVATRVSRQPLSSADFAPPAAAVGWAAWGVRGRD